ncbi:hypothetical protein HNP86_001728 [Methanococcus maripaludis]|uniref:Thoeris protein ThsA Macro domain-containing protein n=1 Tax=Methanococcus maripaludis TaxID=39152 RepID=A0A7J9NWD7_METMI|nr:macro domain-containing protein [Methanococcus maripaludis]MBA2851575.1 hypothetical protein [Methanococcus maripaludis]
MKITKNKKIISRNLERFSAYFATLFSCISVFFQIYEYDFYSKIALLLAVSAIICLCTVYSSRNKSKIALNANKKTKINIVYGDLFDHGDIIIPVNEYFDTVVDEDVISSNTLHGKFLNKVFGSNIAKLDELLDQKLDGLGEVDNDRKQGKKTRYPLGTMTHVDYSGRRYYLLALSKFDNENKAFSDTIDYQNSIYKMLKYLHNNSQGNAVYIPLIGAGQSGIKLSKQELLEYLICSIKAYDDLTLSGGVTIVLHNSVSDDIDLNKIEYMYNI